MAFNGVTKYETIVRYMKCSRNHAIRSMAIVLDGCGEFTPVGKEGTPNFAFCAACGCHRSFHKRIERLVPIPFRSHDMYQPLNNSSPIDALLAPSHTTLKPTDVIEGEMEKDKEVGKKFRTKISPEQKEVLKAFADRGGWTFRNFDEEEIMQVCSELGITRSILKNWINNNKKKMMPRQQSLTAKDPNMIILQS